MQNKGIPVFFGEALFRFSAHGGERLRWASSLDFHLGGTELNIAANLKALGHACGWASLLPEGEAGDLIMERALALGLNLKVLRAKGSPGWYLLEPGAAPKGDRVLARVASVLAHQQFDINWDAMAQGASFFHTSGVTAGLSPACTKEVERAMAAMKKAGAVISYDFNFRKNLWSLEESVARQKSLLPLIDVLFCSELDLELHFGVSSNVEHVFQATTLQTVVISRRGADDKTYAVRILNREGRVDSREYPVSLVDRIGMGDAMAAGFWSARLDGFDLQKTADFAAACGAMKAAIKGDMALVSKSEVLELVTDGFRAVRR